MKKILKKYNAWCFVASIAMCLLLTFCSVGGESSETAETPETTPTPTDVILFAPQGLTTTYLIDKSGGVVNTWESNNQPGLSVYLLEDKSLLRTASPGNNSTFGNTGGAGGRVERFDWDGNQVWEFDYSSDTYLLHHDIEYLPSGNILMIAWEYKSREEAVAAGRNPTLLSEGELWPDKLIEVEPTGSSGGTIVWEWRIWDHLIQEYDESKTNYGVVSENPGKINLNMIIRQGRADWTHINAVDYNPQLDQIMVTVHNFSEIWLIDHNTTTAEAAGPAGDLLYRWGNPLAYERGTRADQQLFVPHDGRWIEDDCPGAGNILIFNNGTQRPMENYTSGRCRPLMSNYSTVDQLIPPENGIGGYNLDASNAYGPSAPNWTYIASPSSDFYASHISGAQRLPDGNTLICNGTAGTFFEVTADGETVWEYVSPYSASTQVGNSVFRAVHYSLLLEN